jgi:methionyl-tRNA formyltransferase
MRLTTYTQNQKLEAVKLWILSGNLTATAVALKIPYDTLKQWRYQDWWNDLALEIRSEGKVELSAKLRKIAEKALGETLERLENGDVRISPTGELQRVPVTAAVASKIATDFVQKAEELERIPQEQSLQTVTDRLKALQESFTKISSKIRKVEVFDAEFKDALQITGPSQMDVRQQTQNGEEMGIENPKHQEAA